MCWTNLPMQVRWSHHHRRSLPPGSWQSTYTHCRKHYSNRRSYAAWCWLPSAWTDRSADSLLPHTADSTHSQLRNTSGNRRSSSRSCQEQDPASNRRRSRWRWSAHLHLRSCRWACRTEGFPNRRQHAEWMQHLQPLHYRQDLHQQRMQPRHWVQ